MITIVVEDGTGVTGANSYVTTAEITEWVLSNPHDTTWIALGAAAMNGYAVMSCRVMEEQMDWDGWQTDDEQARDLPRSGMVDKNGNYIDSDEIPTSVKNAQSERARLLALVDRTADPVTAGFKEIGVGSIKLVIDKFDRSPVMADAVWNMIHFLGSKISLKGVSEVIRI